MRHYGVLALIGLIIACSSGGSSSSAPSPSGSVNSTLKVLASNVIMPTANAADLTGVDTTTKVLASNVTLDTKGLGIVSTNVQDAFGETEPDPSSALVGAWTGQQVSTLATSSGNITLTLNADGTYSCTNDSAYKFVCGTPATSKWEVVGKRILKITNTPTSCSSSTSTSGATSNTDPSASKDVCTTPPTVSLYPILYLGTKNLEFMVSSAPTGGVYFVLSK